MGNIHQCEQLFSASSVLVAVACLWTAWGCSGVCEQGSWWLFLRLFLYTWVLAFPKTHYDSMEDEVKTGKIDKEAFCGGRNTNCIIEMEGGTNVNGTYARFPIGRQ
ncbi:hypothetical protein BDV96DRAFT_578923 [Lophiotrema nucula]|uniref:Uncharacterized protein n=1 Tax=Lophiotrema nucula TaxID=690887 RepID=A0A6A5Z2Z7_9PLEO|nr:hypothetical protein BDV96DRAFT_578923 [Lophiotrema nucula]